MCGVNGMLAGQFGLGEEFSAVPLGCGTNTIGKKHSSPKTS